MKRRLFLGTALGGLTAACCKAVPALAAEPTAPTAPPAPRRHWVLPKGVDFKTFDALSQGERENVLVFAGRVSASIRATRSLNTAQQNNMLAAWINYYMTTEDAFALPTYGDAQWPSRSVVYVDIKPCSTPTPS